MNIKKTAEVKTDETPTVASVNSPAKQMKFFSLEEQTNRRREKAQEAKRLADEAKQQSDFPAD